MKKLIVLTVALAAVAAQARHVRETMTLAKGWNAVYLESTPDDATCADFFAGSPVVSVGNYVSDATDATAQYRSDGSEVNQKPVQFKSWFAGSERASTLRTLFGGNVYVIYASNSWSKAFLGVPSVPDFDWHKADKGGNGSLNLVGVSAPAGAVTSPADYFGPGPFGSDGAVYQIGGLGESVPSFLPLTLGRAPRIYGGQAYALTADVAENWPGVIRIGGVSVAGLDFGASARTVSFTAGNASAAERTFRFTCRASAADGEPYLEEPLALSRLVKANAWDHGRWEPAGVGASWEVTLAGGVATSVELGLDRRGMEAGRLYGVVIDVEDLSGSGMRVRVPVKATAASEDEVDRQSGLWGGSVILTHVSQLTNGTPVTAGGEMKAMILLHVGAKSATTAGRRQVTLLSQAVVSAETDADSNAVARVRTSLGKVPAAAVAGARRITSGILSQATPQVAETEAATVGFGTLAQFDWTVGETACDNPFRHAWHPDHKTGIAVSNSLQLVWKAGFDGHYKGPAIERDESWFFDPEDPDGISSGYLVWRMSGLAKTPIVVTGKFVLSRLVAGDCLDKEEK